MPEDGTKLPFLNKPNHLNFQEFYHPLIDIVQKASKAILKVYEDPTRFAVNYKEDNSPLTAADQASNLIICENLENLYPEIPIISEENRNVDYSERSGYDYCWMVDPLDGTKEFVKRNGEFTINIALIHQGESVLGIMHIPVTGVSFLASKGDTAYIWKDDHLSGIRCRSYDHTSIGLGLVCSRSHLNDATRSYVDQYEQPVMVPKGSALKFTVIAMGEADIYPRLGPTMEWDTAAAQIILESAGGKVLDFETRMPLRYNKPNLLNPNFIACGDGEIY